MTRAAALAFVAAALLAWPGAQAVTRLQRVVGASGSSGSGECARDWSLPSWPRSRGLRCLFVIGAVGAVSQVLAVPVALVVVGISATAGAALVRGSRERASVGEEQAAGEGIGILVAELRAGRPADQALGAAGRHCHHPAVGSLLSTLAGSLRLGERLENWLEAEDRASAATQARWSGSSPGQRVSPASSGMASSGMARSGMARSGTARSSWELRLIAGVALSQRTGCALADVAAAVETDLARRARQRADVRATAAGHRATVGLLAGLPILGLAMGSGIGAEPVRILTSTTIGHVLLVGGVALELLGLAWSRQLTGRALREG